MIFELGKTYIVDVTEKGIMPLMKFDQDKWFNKDCDDLDFLTDEEKVAVINYVLDKIRAEIKTGHWIFDEILDKHYYCSECKSMGVDYWDYCPYCGAKMIEQQESEE